MKSDVQKYVKLIESLVPSISPIESTGTGWAEGLVRGSAQGPTALTMNDPASVCVAAWAQLNAFRAWDRSEAGAMGRIVAAQYSNGSFFNLPANLAIEMQTYYELVLLHAITSYAVEFHDAAAMQSVARAADFHVNETQPDHATTQPWAVHAFVLHPPARSFADQMLHALRTQAAGRIDRISLLLLADAIYCLSRSENDV